MTTSVEQKTYRERHPEYDERNRKLQKARREALRNLVIRYPLEYRRLLHRACARAKIDPPKDPES